MYVKICPFFKLLNHLRENGSLFLNAKMKKQPKWKLNKEVELVLEKMIILSS